MKGLGTIINTAAVILGGLLGLLIKGGVPEKIKNILIQACGLATLFIGISGALKEMITVTNNSISVSGTILVVCSLSIGAFIGQLIDIEKHLDNLGEKLKKLAHAENDNQFVDGFVTVSLIICVGAMAIMGSIQDGLTGDYSTLLAKAILDAIIVLVFASSMGLGPIFSAIPIFVYQGGITLLAVFIAPYMSDAMISEMSMVGSVLIFGVGINLIWPKKLHIGNMLPALLVPVIYELGKMLFL